MGEEERVGCLAGGLLEGVQARGEHHLIYPNVFIWRVGFHGQGPRDGHGGSGKARDEVGTAGSIQERVVAPHRDSD